MDALWVGASPANYTKGRTGRVTHVTIHHAATTALAAVDATFAAPSRQASAHYGVHDGTVHQYVAEGDTAWSDGNWASNTTTISIEMVNLATGGDWPVSGATFDTTARLVADILKRHGLGHPSKGTTVTWHQMYTATACPGGYMLGRMDDFISLAKNYYDGAVMEEPKNRVTLWSPNGGWHQRWVLLPQGDGTYKLGNAANGCVLDVEGGKDAAGTAVIWWPDKGDGSLNQRWLIEPVGEDIGAAYTIRSAMPGGLVMDIEKASSADGARAILWPHHGGANQLWGPVPAPDGESFYLISSASGKLLDANL